MEIAERAAMDATVIQTISAVNTRLAHQRLKGEVPNVAEWSRRNPFELAGMSPRNFAGLIDPLQPSALERGSWAYDPQRAELVYSPRLASGLTTPDPDGLVRFRVEVGPRGLGYMLVPTPAYTWR